MIATNKKIKQHTVSSDDFTRFKSSRIFKRAKEAPIFVDVDGATEAVILSVEEYKRLLNIEESHTFLLSEIKKAGFNLDALRKV